jgi:predicted GIY-YIG superfamily endonuclease
MHITEAFLQSGASDRGGWSRDQLTLLGVDWPPPRGWKRALLGQCISDEDAEKFIALRRTSDGASGGQPTRTGSAAARRTYWLYLLELANGHFYVGMTHDVETRFKKHCRGAGAGWTARHRPLRILRCADTGLTLDADATRIEDELTLQTMEAFGRDRVRGGKYCALDQSEVDAALLSHGHWHRVERAALDRRHFEVEVNWSQALDQVLALALDYYASPGPSTRDALFSAMYGLTQYRFWHRDFDAALDNAFWDRNGILPVLLSFRENRPVASQVPDLFSVLAAAMTRTRRNGPPFHHLFLYGWTAFAPVTHPPQRARIERWARELTSERDRRYDEFTAVLLPPMRYLLRNTA